MLLHRQEESPQLHGWPETRWCFQPLLRVISSPGTSLAGISVLMGGPQPSSNLSKFPSPQQWHPSLRSPTPPRTQPQFPMRCTPLCSSAQLPKAHPAALRALSPRNVRADTFSLQHMGLVVGRRRQRWGKIPARSLTPVTSVVLFQPKHASSDSSNAEEGAYELLLDFCLTVNQPSQFPSDMMSHELSFTKEFALL